MRWGSGVLLSLALCLLVSAISSPVVLAQEQRIDVLDKSLRVVGFGISKSAVARLVNILDRQALDDPPSQRKRFYLPAGTRLALLDMQYTDSGGRIWQLAATDDGLLIFVKGKHKYKSGGAADYYDKSIIEEKNVDRPNKLIAVVQNSKRVQTKNYGDVGLSQSEVYAVVDPEVGEEKISIVLDKSKLGELWKEDETIEISTEDVEVISSEAFAEPISWSVPFTRYDFFAEAQRLFEDAVRQSRRRDETLGPRFSDFMSSRFVENKECDSEIEFSANIDGELGIDVSNILSPLTAKLGLTGRISGAKKYGEGEDFDIVRVKRSASVYEIKTDRTREDCSSEPKSIRTTVSRNADISGEITSGGILSAGFESGNNGFPVYTCREEFLRLRDILSNRYGLSKSIATFVIGLKGEFPAGSDVNNCRQLKPKQEMSPAIDASSQ
jgi:hypothetical protein